MSKKKKHEKKGHPRRPRIPLNHWFGGRLKSSWPLLRVYLMFGVSLLLLFTLTMFDPVVDNVLVPFNSFLAWSTAAMLNLLGGGQVLASETDVYSQSFTFSIAEGCNGLYALAIVIAGMIAIPIQPKSKALGLILAVVLVMVLNYVRILTLWYAGNTDSFVYDMMHMYLWEFVIIFLGAGFLYLWYERSVAKS